MTPFVKKQLRMFLWNILISTNLYVIIMTAVYFYIGSVLNKAGEDFNKGFGSAFDTTPVKKVPVRKSEFNSNWK